MIHDPSAPGAASAMAAALTALALFAAPGLEAQEVSVSPPLSGTVVDASTGRPVRGAILRLVGGHVIGISNRDGYFRVLSIPAGRHEIEIGTTGYTSLRATVSTPSDEPHTFSLDPAPFDLGVIEVSVTARLEERRRGAPSRVEAFTREELQTAIAADVGAFLEGQGVAQFVTCGDEFAPGDVPNCYQYKSELRRIVVYIDDLQEIDGAGTSMLWAFDPRDLWAVEFLHDCGELRIYTVGYQERLSRGAATLRPMLCEPAVR